MVNFRQLERQSVQEFEDKDSLGYSLIWFEFPYSFGILPNWGSHERDRVLRGLYRNPYNWIGQAAVAALVRKIKQVPYTITAGRNNAAYYQGILNDAHFGTGWGTFLSRLLLDFLTCDYGAYIEIIGRGDPRRPIKGRINGISTLDSLRCAPTGNLEFPVVYVNRKSGKLHAMHNTRILRLVDMPDGDEARFDCGMSAMSRAVAMIEQQIPLQKYVSGMMDDKPPIGIFYNNSNMTKDQWDTAFRDYMNKRHLGRSGLMVINNANAGTSTVGGEFLHFADAPEGFEYEIYIEIAVNAFAAAFGIDRQDIWPLTGAMAGTATQSLVLNEKARGMAFGDILTMIERAMNNAILPRDVEFNFEYRDEEKDKLVADRDNVILVNATQLSSLGVPDDSVMRYLANNSEQFRDVFTDAQGEIIELPDDDKKPLNTPDELVDTEEQTPQSTNGANADQDAIRDDNLDESDEEDTVQDEKSRKALDDTRSQFTSDFNRIMKARLDNRRNTASTRTRLRGLLADTGEKAFIDGLEDGGVDSSEISSRDRQTIERLTVDAASFVSDFVRSLGDGITETQATMKADLWWNKSVDPFHLAGLASADANAMYRWRLGPTDHCPTCLHLSIQRHRLKVWLNSGWHPRSGHLDCGGYQCQCRFVKTGKNATGRLPPVSPTR